MKKLIIIAFMLTPFLCQAQERKNFALSYGTGIGKITTFNNFGSRTNEGKSLDIFGISYSSELKKNLFFETGFQLIRYQYITRFTISMGTFSNDNTLKMFSVPFKLRYEIGDYLFFNGGLMVDISKESMLDGIGTGLGIGLQTKVFKGFSLSVNPQANIHSLLNFSGNDYFAETNLNFGLKYRIK